MKLLKYNSSETFFYSKKIAKEFAMEGARRLEQV